MEGPHAHESLTRLRKEVARVVIGQDAIVNRLLIALLIRGHVLVEGLPGLAKTLLVKTLARRHRRARSSASSSRPTCCRRTSPARRSSIPRAAPSTPASDRSSRTSSSPTRSTARPRRCRARCSRRCRSGRSRSAAPHHALPEPFVVIATQNPIEHEGTYALPEAQVDRFVMKLRVDYPTPDEELRMLGMYLDPMKENVAVQRVLDARRDPRHRPARRARPHRRAHRPLHRPARHRHAQARRLPPPVAHHAHRLRRIAPRNARARTRRQGARIPRRPRVRCPRGRERPWRMTCCGTGSCSSYEAAAEQHDGRPHRGPGPWGRRRAVSRTVAESHSLKARRLQASFETVRL